jgi:hypothetical protein
MCYSFFITVTKYITANQLKGRRFICFMVSEVLVHEQLSPLLWPVVRQSIMATGECGEAKQAI